MKLKWIALSALAFSLALVSPAMMKAHAAPLGTAAVGAAQDRDGWDRPPEDFRDVQRKGYHDGIEAARHDFEHHHHADADDHDAYRHPHVSRDDRDAYREGFRRVTSGLWLICRVTTTVTIVLATNSGWRDLKGYPAVRRPGFFLPVRYFHRPMTRNSQL